MHDHLKNLPTRKQALLFSAKVKVLQSLRLLEGLSRGAKKHQLSDDLAEAEAIGVPFLGELPLHLDVRVAGDSGTPIAAGDGPVAEADAALAKRLVDGGLS